jgi:NADH-quinone oxidoreductase subunit J
MQDFTHVFLFYFLAIASIIAASVTALSRNLVTAAFALFVALLAQSGFFIMLGADFLAIVQVVVYVGGILTLLLFGILLTNRNIGAVSGQEETGSRTPAILAGLLLLILILMGVGSSGWLSASAPVASEVAAFAPKTSELGAQLVSKHLLAFELAGMLLLAALLGAAFLVRKRDA